MVTEVELAGRLTAGSAEAALSRFGYEGRMWQGAPFLRPAFRLVGDDLYTLHLTQDLSDYFTSTFKAASGMAPGHPSTCEPMLTYTPLLMPMLEDQLGMSRC